ncbi:MAG: methyltransferase domain-containing protein [bacterium]|nr:methyltransferase domain-containing protein [bacterium]
MKFGILGSNKAISLAELTESTHITPSMQVDSVMFFESDDRRLHDLQYRLAGMQKFGEVIGKVYSDSELRDFLVSMLVSQEGRIQFGLSVYDIGGKQDADQLRANLDNIGLSVKRALKQAGFPVRYIQSKDGEVTSVISRKNNLPDKGGDIALFVDQKGIQIGEVHAVQDYGAWRKRDMDRPGRDARRGMLPPKLARIMLNLAGEDIAGKTILDPFCGSGTVLAEAAMLGAGKLIGSDISEKAVKDTKRGVRWLLEEEALEIPYEIHHTKAGNITAMLEDATIDIVVTEPYLGAPRKGREDARAVRTVVQELEELYRESFSSVKNAMKTGGVMIVASPVHYVRDLAIPVRIREVMKEVGMKEKPFSETLLYRREGQYVGREIVRFIV